MERVSPDLHLRLVEARQAALRREAFEARQARAHRAALRGAPSLRVRLGRSLVAAGAALGGLPADNDLGRAAGEPC